MRVVKILTVVLMSTVLFSCNSQGVTKRSLKTEIDSVSYALGVNIASSLKQTFEDIDTDLVLQGYKNGADSLNILIPAAKTDSIIRTFMQKKQMADQKKQQADALAKAEKEFAPLKAASEKFLAENKTKEGVKTTASGLQYLVMKEGSGEKPLATSKVKVHYHGTLLDGTVFDSSVDKGEPYSPVINQMIKGWIEGIPLMSVGSKYKFFVPSELAYGASPRPGGPIKPFAALIFEVELLEILQK